MMSFRYKAFGLIMESEIDIPEFKEITGDPDVIIKVGEVPGKLKDPQFTGVRYQASPGQFLLCADHIARYLVEDGRIITVCPDPEGSPPDVRLFLLGSAIGALIHQRGMLPLHGSSLIIQKKAYIFSGISGAGKSTLAAGLIRRGYQLLSDDISVVGLSGENLPLVYAGYPGVKLWADSLQKLGMDPARFARVRASLDKHHMHVGTQFHSEAVPLAGVYLLQTKNSEGIMLEDLKGIEKFNALKNNTYRLNFIQGLKNSEAHFRHLSAISSQCRIKRLSRSSKSFSLDELLDVIEKDVHGE